MNGDPPEGSGQQRPWSMPSSRRVGDFIFTIAPLERSYQSLKAERGLISKRLDAVQRQTDEQNGQLKFLMAYVQNALDKDIEAKVEQAAARHIERLVAKRSDPPADDR